MTGPKLDRRQLLKLEAAAMAALAGGMPAASVAANLVTERAASELNWDKAPCRFCGTGCSVMVATKDNRVVATHGDIKSEVNRGLNCVKGYFLSKIMYGHDRLTRPMLRKSNGKFDKDGEFTPVSWDEAFDIMAEKFKAALKKRGPSGIGMLGSGRDRSTRWIALVPSALRPVGCGSRKRTGWKSGSPCGRIPPRRPGSTRLGSRRLGSRRLGSRPVGPRPPGLRRWAAPSSG